MLIALADHGPAIMLWRRTALTLTLCLFSLGTPADWTHARCDIYPRGEDQTSAVVPCVFAQRQGSINIDRSDGISYDLAPRGDRPGNYTDKHGRTVYRKSDLGKAGQIFQFPDETVYVYWDTAGLPGTLAGENYAAPYTTEKFDATTRISCSLSGPGMTEKIDCAIGINRSPKPGQAVVAIMRRDGVERVLQFEGEQVVSPGKGKVSARLQSDDWVISIDDKEVYRIPLAVIEGS